MRKFGLALTMAAALSCMTAMADDVDGTFQFVDEEGNVIEDGSTVTINGMILAVDEYDDDHFDSGIYVLNTTGERMGIGLDLTISQIDGSLSCCFPGSCTAQDGVVSEYDNGKSIMEANENRSLHTDYYPNAYGTCTAVMRLRVHEAGVLNAGDFKAYGPSITINFVYDENSAGIDGVRAASDSEAVGYYTLDGKRLESPRQGVNIVRYADGTTAKKVVR